MITIGSEGLQDAKLILVQNETRAFTIVHKDDQGHVIDHSASTARMAVASPKTGELYDFSDFCTCAESAIYVAITPAASAAVPIGKKYSWDVMVEDENGNITRLLYGPAEVYDSYAFDEVE